MKINRRDEALGLIEAGGVAIAAFDIYYGRASTMVMIVAAR